MQAESSITTEQLTVQVHEGRAIDERLPSWHQQFLHGRTASVAGDVRWLPALESGLKQSPYCIEAVEAGRTAGLLPLMHVKSWLFGSFLVSLPYINSAGVIAESDETAARLIDHAGQLADRLNVQYLELRHELPIAHKLLTKSRTDKVHMRLPLPESHEELWNGFNPKVRNQIRKGEKQEFAVEWGTSELLDDYYAVFSRNMRDLGTPVFSRQLFASILEQFSREAEFCVVRDGGRAIAAALLLHGTSVTEVPSASSLREYNSANANMLMYWNLLQRSVERGQATFDFGRSSEQSNTFRFKKQWGAEPQPAVWQYYVRRGEVGGLRPDNAKYGLMIRAWQKLPLWASNLLGPPIVRGIP